MLAPFSRIETPDHLAHLLVRTATGTLRGGTIVVWGERCRRDVGAPSTDLAARDGMAFAVHPASCSATGLLVQAAAPPNKKIFPKEENPCQFCLTTLSKSHCEKDVVKVGFLKGEGLRKGQIKVTRKSKKKSKKTGDNQPHANCPNFGF
ncbi:MAG: hypothetical protein OJI67_20555 [Prosthecobacter sp.]|nr:hypothetical protein [Prosthecobacter sp.]